MRICQWKEKRTGEHRFCVIESDGARTEDIVLLFLTGDDSFERIANVSAQLLEGMERSKTQKDQNFRVLY